MISLLASRSAIASISSSVGVDLALWPMNELANVTEASIAVAIDPFLKIQVHHSPKPFRALKFGR